MVDWWEQFKTTATTVSLGFSTLITIFDFGLLLRQFYAHVTKRNDLRNISGLPLIPTFFLLASFFCYWTNPAIIRLAAGIIIADIGYLLIGYLLSYMSSPKTRRTKC